MRVGLFYLMMTNDYLSLRLPRHFSILHPPSSLLTNCKFFCPTQNSFTHVPTLDLVSAGSLLGLVGEYRCASESLVSRDAAFGVHCPDLGLLSSLCQFFWTLFTLRTAVMRFTRISSIVVRAEFGESETGWSGVLWFLHR